MRYWILSQKIACFLLKTVDPWFKCKTHALYALLMGWIVAEAFLEIYFWWKPREA